MTRKGRKKVSHRKEEIVAAAGAIAGASIGAVAGPPGMIAGAIIGGVIGTVAGNRLEKEDAVESQHDAELDRAIGVTAGDLGAASPNQPPAIRGAYSAASTGTSTQGDQAPSEGPLQNLDED
jgi:phage tail tape-measure protein